jgi:hypothetical protein
LLSNRHAEQLIRHIRVALCLATALHSWDNRAHEVLTTIASTVVIRHFQDGIGALSEAKTSEGY